MNVKEAACKEGAIIYSVEESKFYVDGTEVSTTHYRMQVGDRLRVAMDPFNRKITWECVHPRYEMVGSIDLPKYMCDLEYFPYLGLGGDFAGEILLL